MHTIYTIYYSTQYTIYSGLTHLVFPAHIVSEEACVYFDPFCMGGTAQPPAKRGRRRIPAIEGA